MNTLRPFDIVVIGGASTDFLFHTERLPCGETVQGNIFIETAGGRGLNQAIAAARCGARVALIAKVGSDTRGHALIERLEADGVDTEFVFRERQEATGAVSVQIDRHGHRQSISVQGANERLTPSDIQEAAQILRDAHVVLAQLEVPSETVRAAFLEALKGEAIRILDSSPLLGPSSTLQNTASPRSTATDDVLSLAEILRIDADEATELTGIPVLDDASAETAAEILHDRTTADVILGTGRDPHLLFSGGVAMMLPDYDLPAINAEGAADALAGALAAELARDEPIVDAAEFANAAAALANSRFGTHSAMPFRAEVERLLEERTREHNRDAISRKNSSSHESSASSPSSAPPSP